MSEPSLDAVRRDQSGWIFLHIEGEPYDRGEQHGQLLATEIQNAIRTSAQATCASRSRSLSS